MAQNPASSDPALNGFWKRQSGQNSTTTSAAPTGASLVSVSDATTIISSTLTPPAHSTTIQNGTAITPVIGSSQVPTNGTPASPGHSSDRLSNGAVAGIGVGVGMLGIIIGVAAAIIFLRKRKRRGNGTPQAIARAYQPKSEVKPDYDALLPQPIDTASLKQEVQSLYDTIDGHVQNFYHNQTVGAQPVDKHDVSFNTTGLSVQRGLNFPHLLVSSKTRPFAITALITSTLLDSIDPYGAPAYSLLPSIVPEFLHSLGRPDWDSHAQSLCSSRWRISTAFLLKHLTSENVEFDAKNKREAVVRHLTATLGPFIATQKRANHDTALFSLCKRTEILGMLLLSQPIAWEFIWSPGNHAASKSAKPVSCLVVYPGLGGRTDATGRKVERPQLVLEPYVKQLV